MAFPEFQTKEVLNKVLNSGKDALNVDLSDSVTVTVDSEFPAAAALADDSGNPTTTSVGSHLLGYDSGNTNWNRVEVDDAGHLQIDVLSITAGDNNIGNVDIASIAAGDNNIGNVDIASALPAGSNTIGVVDLGSTDNAVLDAIAASLALLDNSIQSGNELQVDIVGSLPAGSAAIGKLAANSGVDIGDVDVTSLPASTNTIEVVGDAAEDAAVAGNPLLSGGRYDATQRTLDDGDAGALAIDPSGALYTREYTGQDGAVYTTASSDAIKPPTGKAWVAIQMIEDSTFDSSGGLVAVTATKWFNTADAAGDLGAGSESTAEGSGGKQIDNSVTFPQGMTIFGRWSEIDVNSGSIIAYIGDY
jgi:hypothetical protein